VGAKTAYRLAKELNLETLSQLKKAALAGRVEELSGFKEKTANQLLKAIEEYREGEGRMLLPIAFAVAERLIEEILKMPGVRRADPLGSLRRMVSTIGDIDIGIATTKPAETVEAFVNLPGVARVLGAGKTKASVLLKTGKQVDIRVHAPQSYGALLQYFTGSKSHNIHLRKVANERGLSLSEYGISKFKGGKVVGQPMATKTEEEFYKKLSMDWIPPELREDNEEIEAALKGKLPRLVEIGDIKGDAHTHTTASDGEDTADEMVRAAIAHGLEYYGIADHAPSVQVLGVKKAREEILRRKWEVEELRRKYQGKIKLFFSAEVDITASAKLELPDDLLALFDYTTASIHSGFRQPRDQITKRLLSALKNPYVDVLGHPTGRQLGRREACEADWDEVFRVAREEGKLLEINAVPTRLDLPDTLVRKARDKGVKFVINTDSHRTAQLDNLRFGVAVARRGWCGKSDIINTLSAEKFLKALRVKKGVKDRQK
jgi:DNA polymerase (family 10)